MTGLITSFNVSKSILPLTDICSGTLLNPPYVVPQSYYVCITANVKNNGSKTEEYKLQLISPQGNVVDTEPDTYWINISPGQTKSISVSGNLLSAGLYNFSIRLKRCVCTSWTGCLTSCDSEPIDDIKNITVTTYEVTTPSPLPSIIYYECVNGTCKESYSVTPYTSLQACQVTCTTQPTIPSTNPPSNQATSALKISLSATSWANYNGLLNYLPSITTKMAELVTLYGWLGWTVVESKIEENNLVIYFRESNIMSMWIPTAATIIASIGIIATYLLRFGYIIIGWKLIELATGVTKVAQTNAETNQIRTKTISDMCASGELTPTQCTDALEKASSGSGLCGLIGLTDQDCKYIKYGAIAIGALIIIKVVSDLIPKSNK